MTFCVAQATLGLLKLTQPDKVDRWSFQTLQCVPVKTRQFGLHFGHSFAWQVMRLRPVTTLAAALSPSRPFPGGPHEARNQPKQAQVRKRTPRLYSTYNNSFHVPDVWVVFCVRIIVLSYAGPNTVYCPRTTYNTISGHDREIMPAYSRR